VGIYYVGLYCASYKQARIKNGRNPECYFSAPPAKIRAER
jgi:hypothetical protein